MKPKALVSWSSGKDSAFALHHARLAGELELVGLLTTVTSSYGRVSMHGVREELLERQACAVGLPLRKVSIAPDGSAEDYQRVMRLELMSARDAGVTHVVFGDLFLAELRAYREEQLAQLELHAVFPLLQRDTAELARTMIAGGLEATLTCVDPRRLSGSFAGKRFDAALLEALPAGVDPCGENGEFHTCVTAGPMFAQPIAVRGGEVVERGGFVFADVIPT